MYIQKVQSAKDPFSEHGLATHFIPSRRIPELLGRLAALEKPLGSAGDWKTITDIQERSVEWKATIDTALEELHYEREPGEPAAPFTGAKRVALDTAFRHSKVEKIIEDLESFTNSDDTAVRAWAKETLSSLHMRSPTSLKVALQAIRKGKELSLLDALQMELRIATAFCVSQILLNVSF
jgi:3-hydroxyisobutyryl-CoA hydrolase